MWEWTPLWSWLMVLHVNVYLFLVSFLFSSCGKCSLQAFSFQFLSNIFLFPFPPVSLEHLHSLPVSWGQVEKDPTGFPKNQAWGILCSPCLLETGAKSSVPLSKGEPVHTQHASCCSCTTTGSDNTRVSLLSQLYPHFPSGHSRAADKQERGRLGWKTSCP